jgi:hydroxyacylglutathione hydrolase
MKIINFVVFCSIPAIIFFLVSCGLDKNIKERTEERIIKSQLIMHGIHAIQNDWVNFFLIKNNGEYIAIDAGWSKDTTVTELKKLDIGCSAVKAVFLTHSDIDHVACLDLFTNAAIYISKAEEPLITGKKSRFLFYYNSRIKKPYKLLEDNQILTVSGLKIECISTPGHTIGSMSFIINNKYLFLGDAFAIIDGKAACFDPDVEFGDLYNMDAAAQVKSIKRVSLLSDILYIFTAHYGYVAYDSSLFE